MKKCIVSNTNNALSKAFFVEGISADEDMYAELKEFLKEVRQRLKSRFPQNESGIVKKHDCSHYCVRNTATQI